MTIQDVQTAAPDAKLAPMTSVSSSIQSPQTRLSIRHKAPYARLALLMMLSLTALTGCLSKHMVVTSTPPGAQLYINDHNRGKTPAKVPYLYSGDYTFRLELEGHETIEKTLTIDPKFYQHPYVDAVPDIMIPAEIKDERHMSFTLKPYETNALEPTLKDARTLQQDFRALQQPQAKPSASAK